MLFVTLIILHLASKSSLVGCSSIGVCYGTKEDNLPSPQEVVGLYKLYNIKRMRLYEPDHEIFEALYGSHNIEVSVGIRNEHLQELALSNTSAIKWVKRNILYFWPGVKFRYIAVGDEAIPGPYAEFVLPAMKQLRDALASSEDAKQLCRQVKVSTVVRVESLLGGGSWPPSAAAFSVTACRFMESIAQHLRMTGAPLLANVHPYLRYIENPQHIHLHYARFIQKPANLAHKPMVKWDGDFEYYNLFDEIVDALYVALEKVGISDTQIVVSETGWPLAGSHLTIDVPKNARMYLSNLVKHVSSSNGTPRRKGSIETYLYAMFDQKMEYSDKDKGRHWGIFDQYTKRLRFLF